jgi:hypothetical protein
MKRIRLIILLTVLTVFCGVSLVAPARTQAAVTDCPKALKPEDCDLLAEAGDNFNQFTSFNAEYQFFGQVTGLKRGKISALLGGKAPTKVSANADTFLDAVDSLNFQTTTQGSVTAGGQVYAMGLEVRTMDGDLHFKGVAAYGATGWIKVSLPRVFKAMAIKAPIGANALSDPDLRPGQGLINPNLIADLAQLEAIPGLVTITRQAGPYIDNQRTLQITAKFDMTALAKHLFEDDPDTLRDIADVLGVIVSNPGVRLRDISLDDMLATLKQSHLIVTWYYSINDKLFRGLSYDVQLNFKGNAADVLTGETKQAPIMMRSTITLKISQIGKTFTIKTIGENDKVQDATIGMVSAIAGQ